MEMWNLEGHVIEGKYHGVPFKGKVVSSRATYGAAIAHLVELEKPITVYGEFRDHVIVNSTDTFDTSEYRVVE